MTASGGVSREQYLDNPSDGILDKTRKIHIDYICDFILMTSVLRTSI
ncbi:type I restriction-modification enzyme R subunit [Escherichia coli]|uniref:Type I restriction-modification enzyme R subunit n=1 Tax=Escherichia coli TaxID=562 RepID=A0A2X1P928_ECOLX|nr:type I restriction-modification enzyme R subunit [Escherichia coli]